MADETENNKRRSLLSSLLEHFLEGKLGPLENLTHVLSVAGGEQSRRELLMRALLTAASASVGAEEGQEAADGVGQLANAVAPARSDDEWIEGLLSEAAEVFNFEISVYIGLFSDSYRNIQRATFSSGNQTGNIARGMFGMMSQDFLARLEPSALSAEQVEILQHEANELRASVKTLSEARATLSQNPFVSATCQKLYVANARKNAEETAHQLEEEGHFGGEESFFSNKAEYIEAEAESANDDFGTALDLLTQRPHLLYERIDRAMRGLQLWQQIYGTWLELQQQNAASESKQSTLFGSIARNDHYRPASQCSIHTWNYNGRPVRDVIEH